MFIDIQQALYDRLDTLSIPVYDHVPQGASFPYIVIGNMDHNEWDTDLENGFDIVVDIHVWDRAHNGKKSVKTIQSQIYSLLHRKETLLGSGFVLANAEFASSFLDVDGLTYHGVQRFRLLFNEQIEEDEED